MNRSKSPSDGPYWKADLLYLWSEKMQQQGAFSSGPSIATWWMTQPPICTLWPCGQVNTAVMRPSASWRNFFRMSQIATFLKVWQQRKNTNLIFLTPWLLTRYRPKQLFLLRPIFSFRFNIFTEQFRMASSHKKTIKVKMNQNQEL